MLPKVFQKLAVDGAEELLLLDPHSIPFPYVPGVSSTKSVTWQWNSFGFLAFTHMLKMYCVNGILQKHSKTVVQAHSLNFLK